MTRRHELQRQHDSLHTIGELMAAMKNIAQLECRRIESFMAAQTSATAIIEAAFAEFAHDHEADMPALTSGHDVLLLVGSERGLCGDLDTRLAELAAQRAGDTAAGAVLVGSRLVDHWTGPVEARVAGAQTAGEVQAVLLNLLDTLVPLLARPDGTPVGLRLLHLSDDGMVDRRLLPVPRPATKAPRRGHAVLLNLAPRQYLEGLLEQWLLAAVGSSLYGALLHENQRRMEHMEQAGQRIDERQALLANQANTARQEEITQEIELIQLAVAIDAPD